MSRTEVDAVRPRMRIRLPPEVEETVTNLLSRQHPLRRNRRKKGEAAFDSWSWAHVASGAGLALTGVSWGWSLAMLVGFEAFEAALRRIQTKSAGGLFEYESWPNIMADVATGMVGFAAARLFMGKPLARAAMNAFLPLFPKR